MNNSKTMNEKKEHTMSNIKHALSDGATLVRAPLITDPDGSTHGEYEECRYAFFPGCELCAEEPEIVAKIYDALLFQDPRTAIFIECCGTRFESLKGESSSESGEAPLAFKEIREEVCKLHEEIKKKWQALGSPVMIMACPCCQQVFAEQNPEIPTVSLYEMLEEYGIGGGCNSVEYSILYDECSSNEANAAIKNLAEDMGVGLKENDKTLPIITASIHMRNALKRNGFDSAHILELMFGMGASNTHLIHEHDHDHGEEFDDNELDIRRKDADETSFACSGSGSLSIEEAMAEHDCDGNCSACSLCGDQPSPPSPLPSSEQRQANCEELKQVLLALYWNE